MSTDARIERNTFYPPIGPQSRPRARIRDNRRPMRAASIPPLTLLAVGLASTSARAELDLAVGGRLQSDVRFRIQEKTLGDWYDHRRLPTGVERNENILKLKLNASTDRFRGVVDVDLVYLGRSPDVASLGDLSDRTVVEPFRVEAHALYVEAVDLITDGLDLRIGQQVVSWGVGDQFNPTNTLNAEDLEDVLLFGTQQANLMAKLDYTIPDWVQATALVIPVFRPALLPRSAPLAVAAIDRLPMIDPAVRQRIHVEQAVTSDALAGVLGPAVAGRFPTRVTEVRPVLPALSFENLQLGARLATTVFEHDLALSWYRGFDDFPQAIQNLTEQSIGAACDPDDASDCVAGLLGTQVTLSYPRIQVLGLNMSGELDILSWMDDDLAPIGYRFELGVYFPEALQIRLLQGEIVVGSITRPGGEYDYGLGDGVRPEVLSDTPFPKWTIGLDYTFGRHVYVNAQWVHGFADEMGAGDNFFTDSPAVRSGGVSTSHEDTVSCFFDRAWQRCARELTRPRIGDYLVLGVDLNFSDTQGLFRLFTIFDLSGYTETRPTRSGEPETIAHGPFSADGFSAIVYPELVYNFGDGLELSAGVLLQLGKDHTKFGDPAAGGSLAWTRARFSF